VVGGWPKGAKPSLSAACACSKHYRRACTHSVELRNRLGVHSRGVTHGSIARQQPRLKMSPLIAPGRGASTAPLEGGRFSRIGRPVRRGGGGGGGGRGGGGVGGGGERPAGRAAGRQPFAGQGGGAAWSVGADRPFAVGPRGRALAPAATSGRRGTRSGWRAPAGGAAGTGFEGPRRGEVAWLARAEPAAASDGSGGGAGAGLMARRGAGAASARTGRRGGAGPGGQGERPGGIDAGTESRGVPWRRMGAAAWMLPSGLRRRGRLRAASAVPWASRGQGGASPHVGQLGTSWFGSRTVTSRFARSRARVVRARAEPGIGVAVEHRSPREASRPGDLPAPFVSTPEPESTTTRFGRRGRAQAARREDEIGFPFARVVDNATNAEN